VAILQLDELEPGMVLASDAAHLSGRILLRAGVTLTDHHLKVFRTWGLNEADIEGADPESLHEQKLAAADPAVVEKERAAMSERFHHADRSHPMIDELFRRSLEWIVEKSHK